MNNIFQQERDVNDPRKYWVAIMATGPKTEEEIKEELFRMIRNNWPWLIKN